MKNKERLASLDILRGFDLFCLVCFQPILVHLLYIVDNPSLAPVMYQFDHVKWEGFSFWDLIMPLFLFMSGITIPFAYARFKTGAEPLSAFRHKIIKRFCWLFFLGWIVQGGLLSLNIHQFHPLANTLQSIAIGYVPAALCFVFFSFRKQVLTAIGCFAAYFLVFLTLGHNDFTPEGNIAELIDRAVLGSFRDGVIWHDGTWSFNPDYTYTWVLSSLNFIVTVMLGSFAGHILKQKETPALKRFRNLFLIGIALVAGGLLLSPFHPIIKRIWSSSMTLYSGGLCFLLMAVFYYVIDIKKWSHGLEWLKIYGMNSIVAYVIAETINFRSIGNSVFYGLEQYLGDFYPLVGTIFNFGVVFYILHHMYKHQVFVKI